MSTTAEFLAELPLGTRVVVRYRVGVKFTDALGYLRTCDTVADENPVCTVETKRGLATVALNDVVAAKRVPEAPARRPAHQ